MLALDTNYLYLLIIYSHDDNITSDALTRDMHLQLTRYQTQSCDFTAHMCTGSILSIYMAR